MAKNPDPDLKLTTVKGVSRTLDDWLTVFDLCLVALPGRPEAQTFVGIGKKILDVFRDADCRAAFLIVGGERMARRLLGPALDEYLAFVDPEAELPKSLGLERLPAFVHLGLDTSVLEVAEGWNPAEWNRVAKSLATSMSWTRPVLGTPGDPPPHPGWST